MRALLILGAMGGLSAMADEPPAQPGPGAALPCALTGSSDVLVEGRAMLRLSDVKACSPTQYDIIPGVFVNGEPAVRLRSPVDGPVPASGADSVLIDGAPASRQGDGG